MGDPERRRRVRDHVPPHGRRARHRRDPRAARASDRRLHRARRVLRAHGAGGDGGAARGARRARGGRGGRPQEEGGEYESFFTDEDAWLDPAATAAEAHRLVWAWRFAMSHGELRGALVDLDGETARVLASSLAEVEDARTLDCADGPLWLVETEPAYAAGLPASRPSVRGRGTTARCGIATSYGRRPRPRWRARRGRTRRTPPRPRRRARTPPSRTARGAGRRDGAPGRRRRRSGRAPAARARAARSRRSSAATARRRSPAAASAA